MRARNNPFRNERILALPWLEGPEGVGLDGVLEAFKRHGYQGALIGAEGSGKSFTMERLGVALRREGFFTVSLFLNRDSPLAARGQFFAAARHAPPNAILLLDGVDHLFPGQWLALRFLTRHSRGRILTSHGRAYLPRLERTEASPVLLERIVAILLEGDKARLPFSAEALFHRHGGNLRDCLTELYGAYSLLPEP